MNHLLYHEQFYGSPTATIFEENKYLAALLQDLVPLGKYCLDFGCGTGYWTQHLARCGARVVGIDSEVVPSGALHDCCDCTYIVYESAQLPFADSTFDIVLASWVFQELIQDELFSKVLCELKRVLKSEGRFVVVDNIYPDSRILRSSTALGDIFEKAGQEDLLRLFPQNSVAAILHSLSLDITHHHMCGQSFFEVYRKRVKSS